MSIGRNSPTSFLKHAGDVASFYGFRPVRDIERQFALVRERSGERLERTRGLHSFTTTATLCASYATLRPQEPVLAFYATPSPAYVPMGGALFGPRDVGEFGLQVIGTPESVGEIVLLRTVTMIVSEWGATLARIRVNALGDRDSQQRFMRELSLFVRKHADRLDPAFKNAILENPLLLYQNPLESHRAVASEGPRPMHFLSEKSRSHFRSVLEHLENLHLPYELDDSLVGDERGAHITFALDLEEDDATILASYGGRYDEYLRKESRRKDSTGVGASIFFRKKGVNQSNFSYARAAQKPKIYFAQLGLRAKLQGLDVLDMLRRARVPVFQSFDASRLSSQLADARAQGVSHLLIIGQREALDGTIIVRSMKNSAQTTLQLSDMPRFLKTLRA